MSSIERAPDNTKVSRFSTFLGVQLLNTFTQPLNFRLVAASAGAAVLQFMAFDEAISRFSIRTVACDGTLLAGHVINNGLSTCETLTSGWQDGSLLLMANTSSAQLCICSASGGLQTINLGRPAPPAPCSLSSSYNQLAAVCIIEQHAEVLIVDMARQCVTHRHGLPTFTSYDMASTMYLALAQSSRSLAFCHCRSKSETSMLLATTALATMGTDHRSFVLPGMSTIHLGTCLAGSWQCKRQLAYQSMLHQASASPRCGCHGLRSTLSCAGTQRPVSW